MHFFGPFMIGPKDHDQRYNASKSSYFFENTKWSTVFRLSYPVIDPITEIVIVARAGADLVDHRQTITWCPLRKVEEVQHLDLVQLGNGR